MSTTSDSSSSTSSGRRFQPRRPPTAESTGSGGGGGGGGGGMIPMHVLGSSSSSGSGTGTSSGVKAKILRTRSTTSSSSASSIATTILGPFSGTSSRASSGDGGEPLLPTGVPPQQRQPIRDLTRYSPTLSHHQAASFLSSQTPPPHHSASLHSGHAVQSMYEIPSWQRDRTPVPAPPPPIIRQQSPIVPPSPFEPPPSRMQLCDCNGYNCNITQEFVDKLWKHETLAIGQSSLLQIVKIISMPFLVPFLFFVENGFVKMALKPHIMSALFYLSLTLPLQQIMLLAMLTTVALIFGQYYHVYCNTHYRELGWALLHYFVLYIILAIPMFFVMMIPYRTLLRYGTFNYDRMCEAISLFYSLSFNQVDLSNFTISGVDTNVCRDIDDFQHLAECKRTSVLDALLQPSCHLPSPGDEPTVVEPSWWCLTSENTIYYWFENFPRTVMSFRYVTSGMLWRDTICIIMLSIYAFVHTFVMVYGSNQALFAAKVLRQDNCRWERRQEAADRRHAKVAQQIAEREALIHKVTAPISPDSAATFNVSTKYHSTFSLAGTSAGTSGGAGSGANVDAEAGMMTMMTSPSTTSQRLLFSKLQTVDEEQQMHHQQQQQQILERPCTSASMYRRDMLSGTVMLPPPPPQPPRPEDFPLQDSVVELKSPDSAKTIVSVLRSGSSSSSKRKDY